MKRSLIFNLILFFSAFTFALPVIKKISGESLLSGKNIEVSSQSKKGLVVVFLSARCPCSNSHIEEIKDLTLKYTAFAFVAVHSNSDENVQISKPYFEKANFKFPVIEDHQTELADQLQAYKTPHAFVFLPTGEVAYQGGVSNSRDCEKSDQKFLRQALVEIEVGQKVTTPEGRTLGCGIARGTKK